MFLYTLSVSASVKQSREERVARSSTLYGLLYDALLFESCLLWAREVKCYSYQKKKKEKSSVTVIFRLWRRNYYLDCF